MSKVPDHYKPSGSNYLNVEKNVSQYVAQMFDKVKAIEIVSIEKLATVLKQANYAQQFTENKSKTFIAISLILSAIKRSTSIL